MWNEHNECLAECKKMREGRPDLYQAYLEIRHGSGYFPSKSTELGKWIDQYEALSARAARIAAGF